MTNYQDPNVNQPTQAIEVDFIVKDLEQKLASNLPWVSHGYARAYRHIKEVDGKRLYFPEVYLGKQNGVPSYHRVTPDNDKEGMFFFLVGKESYPNARDEDFTFIENEISIVFWANQELINDALLNTDVFTQHLIRDVRNVLTNIQGAGYKIFLHNIEQEFNQIYREFSLSEDKNYLVAPYTAFRVNLKVNHEADCFPTAFISCAPATYVVRYDNGVLIEQGTIASGGIYEILVPDIVICQNVELTVYDSDENILYQYSIPSGENFPLNISSSTVVLKDSLGNFLDSVIVLSQQNGELIAPNGIVNVVNSLGNSVDNGVVTSGGNEVFNAPNGSATNSNGTFTLPAPSGTTQVIPDSVINVNSISQGNVVSVQAIDINITDGVNPIVPEDVTLLGNTLTVEVNMGWVRNPQWPVFTEALNTIEMVYAVFEDERNQFDLIVSGTHTINWGDGTIETVSTYSHTYDYATIIAPILIYKDGRNYKPVRVLVTLDTSELFSLLFISITGDPNCLDCVVNVDIVTYTNTDYRLSIGAYNTFQERFKTNNNYTNSTLNGRFERMSSLRVFDVPSTFFNNASSFLSALSYSGDNLELGDITHTGADTASMGTMFIGSDIVKVGDITSNFIDGNQNFRFSSIREIGDYTHPNRTLMNFEFNSSQLEKIGVINAPSLTTLTQMFESCFVRDVVFTDCSNVTITTNIFRFTQTLKTLIMPNLTRGVSVNGNSMTDDALDDFMASIGTAAGAQTLDLRNNPGSATCMPSIGTGKGFTVLT